MKKYFECDFYSILRHIFVSVLFISGPLTCVASYYEFMQDYANDRSPISPTWILFNIITVLYYTVDWIMDERWVWVRVYFHVANILLSESCVWLSILKFSSTDPFAAVNDSWSKTPEFYNFIGISYIISWLILVILHTTMNTLIHLIMIYHIHHKTEERTARYTNMLRASFGIFCRILQFSLLGFSPMEKIFYLNVYKFLQILLFFTIWLNCGNLMWEKEAVKGNPFEKLYWRSLEVGTTIWAFRLSLLLWAFPILIKIFTDDRRPFPLHKFHGLTTAEGNHLNQDNSQSYNLIPFIACVHIFSIIREYYTS